MFKFLKEKLKKSVSAFSKKIDEEGEEEVIEVEKQPEEKQGFLKKIFKKKEVSEENTKSQIEEGAKPVQEKPEMEKKVETEQVAETEEISVEEVQKKPDVETEVSKEEVAEPVQDKSDVETEEVTLAADESVDDKHQETPEIKEIDEPDIKPLSEEDVKEHVVEVTSEPQEKAETEIVVTTDHDEAFPDVKPQEKIAPEPVVEEPMEVEEPVEEEVPEKKSLFSKLREKVVTKRISEKKFDEMFWDLEMALLENNVAVLVIEKIKEDLRESLVDKPIRRNKIEETVMKGLKKSVDEVLSLGDINLLKKAKGIKPYVIVFIGINGSGKTTTIAKVAKMFLDNDKKVVLAAADTFRAAAIDQLEIHANNLGIKMIKHDYGSDPAAVAFDSIKYARSKDADVVLIDTAGRLHSNTNLVDEMKKIIRVAEPDLKVLWEKQLQEMTALSKLKNLMKQSV